MVNLDTTHVRRNLAKLQTDLGTLLAHPERSRDLSARLSRLASEITAACEQAFLASQDLPAS